MSVLQNFYDKIEYVLAVRGRRREEAQRQRRMTLNFNRNHCDPFNDPNFMKVYRLTPQLAKYVIEELRRFYPTQWNANGISVEFKSLAENEKNIRFWEDYLNNLKAVDFSVFSGKLRVPALVPVGSRMFFRGELKHTNEVTVALGANYFVKCSVSQAEILRQHRIKGAQNKLNSYKNEKEYLEKQISFKMSTAEEDHGQEIIEYHTIEQDRVWREQHRENIRKHKQKARLDRKDYQSQPDEDPDQSLWDRLEELELQEELENELDSRNNEDNDKLPYYFSKKMIAEQDTKDNETDMDHNIVNKTETGTILNKTASKLDVLQTVIDRQAILEEKIQEMRDINMQYNSRTEKDIILKLDKMEQLEDLEDEMDRLEDIIQNEESEYEEAETITLSEQDNSHNATVPKKKLNVMFNDEDDSETIQLTFKHSDEEPSNKPYEPKEGISKPSDIYEVYSHLFKKEITSILKKTTHKIEVDKGLSEKEIVNEEIVQNVLNLEDAAETPKQTILVDDVIENCQNDNKLENVSRPVSIFKKRRQQMKNDVHRL